MSDKIYMVYYYYDDSPNSEIPKVFETYELARNNYMAETLGDCVELWEIEVNTNKRKQVHWRRYYI